MAQLRRVRFGDKLTPDGKLSAADRRKLLEFAFSASSRSGMNEVELHEARDDVTPKRSNLR